MKRSGWIAVLMLTSHLGFALDTDGVRVSHETFADLGVVTILNPTITPPRDLLLVLDTATSVPAPLFELARQGHLLAHIQLQQFLAKASSNECLNATTLLDVFSQHLQQEFHFTHYQRPLLIGIDTAAAFALATLAQAPSGLFQGGIGIRFQPELNLPAPLCAAPALKVQAIDSSHHLFRLGTITPTAPWRVVADLSELNAAITPREPAPATASALPIDDLPLIELPLLPGKSTGASSDTFVGSRDTLVVGSDAFVVLISGDGGWADIDKDIGETLNHAGLPVVGWNSLQYFWRKKTPEQTSADLARVIAHYRQSWQRPKVALIGFSLGADVLPFMISRLPADARAAVFNTTLLSLSHQVDFEFHVADWLGSNNSQARPIAPELAKLAGTPVLCVYGKTDDDSLCSDRPAGVEVIMLPGDHHFDGDYQTASRLILQHLAKARNSAPSAH